MTQEPNFEERTDPAEELSPDQPKDKQEEKLAQEWEKESFPASDPPANY